MRGCPENRATPHCFYGIFCIRDASVAEHEIVALTLHIEDMDDAILLDKIVAPGRLSRREAVFTDGRPQGAYFLRRLAMMLNAT